MRPYGWRESRWKEGQSVEGCGVRNMEICSSFHQVGSIQVLLYVIFF